MAGKDHINFTMDIEEDEVEQFPIAYIHKNGKAVFSTEQVEYLVDSVDILTDVGDKMIFDGDRWNEEYFDYPQHMVIERTSSGFLLYFELEDDRRKVICEKSTEDWRTAISKFKYKYSSQLRKVHQL